MLLGVIDVNLIWEMFWCINLRVMEVKMVVVYLENFF